MQQAKATDGEFLPDHIIFPFSNIHNDLLLFTSNKRFLHAYPSGWMVCVLFTVIMQENVIVALEKRRIEIRLNKKAANSSNSGFTLL